MRDFGPGTSFAPDAPTMAAFGSFLARARFVVLLFPLYGAFSSFVQGCSGAIRNGTGPNDSGVDSGCEESPYHGYGTRCENAYGYGYGDDCEKQCP